MVHPKSLLPFPGLPLSSLHKILLVGLWDGGFWKAGVKPGDILQEIDGRRIATVYVPQSSRVKLRHVQQSAKWSHEDHEASWSREAMDFLDGNGQSRNDIYAVLDEHQAGDIVKAGHSRHSPTAIRCHSPICCGQLRCACFGLISLKSLVPRPWFGLETMQHDIAQNVIILQ